MSALAETIPTEMPEAIVFTDSAHSNQVYDYICYPLLLGCYL